jgi:DNA-binding NarL/FixJ family response regulator
MHGERSPTEERLAGMSSIRVLVVEDHQSFQQLICSMLGKRPDLQVIGRVSDGLEAVRKAEELQPDLILLDIGLPTLSGIEAARRIRKLSPESKIIFLTQEGSADIVREALDLGAKGYVVKASAGSELLAAVDAVLRGREFVSKGLGHTPTDAAETHVADSRRRDENLLSSAPVTSERTQPQSSVLYR